MMKRILWCSLCLSWWGSVQAGTTLSETMAQAWERSVDGRSVAVRRQEAEANQAIARQWFPEAPTLSVGQQSDRWHRNQGDREIEVELSVPLWLPGQRQALLQVTGQGLASEEAKSSAARLAVAGELRHLLWSSALLQAEKTMAHERLALAEALERDVSKRVRAGEMAKTEGWLAKESWLAAQAYVAEVEGREWQGMEKLRAVTGMTALPESFEEALVEPQGGHPRLAEAQSNVERARAEWNLARETRREAPEFSVAMQRSREERGRPESSTLRFGLKFPFSSDARHASRVAAAQTALTQAEAALFRLEAELASEQRAALGGLNAAMQNEEAARQRVQFSRDRLHSLQRAFTLGELGLEEFIRVRQAASEAQWELIKASHAVKAARAQVNQSRGIIP